MAIKKGRVELVSVDAPSHVRPGSAFEVRLTATNSASLIFNDPDGCSNAGTPCGGKDGFCTVYDAQVYDAAGDLHDQQSVRECLNMPFSGVGKNQEQASLTLRAPSLPQGASSATVEVAGLLRMSASGQTTTPMSTTVTVTTDVEDLPPPGDDDGNGNDGGEPDLNDRLDQLGTLAVLGLGAWALSSASGITDDVLDD